MREVAAFSRGAWFEAGVGKNVGKVVALGAHSVGTGASEVGRLVHVLDRTSRAGNREVRAGDDLAELVAALEDVEIPGTVRTAGTFAAELAIVIGVVAVGAEDALADGTRRSC